MMNLGIMARLKPGSSLRDRYVNASRQLRDYRQALAIRTDLNEASIRDYRHRCADLHREMEEVELIVRRQGKVASSLLKTKSLVGVLKHFTVGFELETQSTCDLNNRSIQEETQRVNQARQPDPAKLERYIRRHSLAAATSTDRTVNLLREMPAIRDGVQRAIFLNWVERSAPAGVRVGAAELLENGLWKSFTPPLTDRQLQEHIMRNVLTPRRLVELGCLTRTQVNELVAKVEAQLRAQKPPVETLTGRYYRNVELIEDRIPKWDRTLLQAATDGSVRGFELRTIGGLSVGQFVRAAGIVFGPGVRHEIDTGCSFHIHVGVRGTEMRYSPEFQAALYEFLFDNIDKVPATVQERWAQLSGDNQVGRYFRPQISREKYSFVHYHERCHTWEFRCFGNVRSKADAVRCLRLALRAMMYAYRVTRAGEKSNIHHADVANMSREIIKCVTKREPMHKVLAAARSV